MFNVKMNTETEMLTSLNYKTVSILSIEVNKLVAITHLSIKMID